MDLLHAPFFGYQPKWFITRTRNGVLFISISWDISLQQSQSFSKKKIWRYRVWVWLSALQDFWKPDRFRERKAQEDHHPSQQIYRQSSIQICGKTMKLLLTSSVNCYFLMGIASAGELFFVAVFSLGGRSVAVHIANWKEMPTKSSTWIGLANM